MIVYLAENQINKKIYVGQTAGTLKRRWKTHCYNAQHGSNTPFHRAIRKHGAGNFSLKVLAHAPNREQTSFSTGQKARWAKIKAVPWWIPKEESKS